MKFCNKCKLAIDTNKERYIKIEDNNGTKNLSKIFFHKDCWKETIAGKMNVVALTKQANQIMNFAKDKMGMGESYNLN